MLCGLIACSDSSQTIIPLYQIPTKEQLYAAGYQDGDLPPEYFDGHYKKSRMPYYDNRGVPVSDVEVTINTGNPPLSAIGTGAITLSWYPSQADVDHAYSIVSSFEYAKTNPVEGIGEKAIYFTNGFVGIGGFVFTRCGILVSMDRGIQPYDSLGFTQQEMFQYAKKIDQRIIDMVCPTTLGQ